MYLFRLWFTSFTPTFKLNVQIIFNVLNFLYIDLFQVKEYQSSSRSQTTRSESKKLSYEVCSSSIYTRLHVEISRETVTRSRSASPRHVSQSHNCKEVQPSIISSTYNGGGETICSICRDNFRMGENVEIIAACLHRYHPPCLAEWLKVSIFKNLIKSLVSCLCRAASSAWDFEIRGYSSVNEDAINQ